jgi:hypothetical protein
MRRAYSVEFDVDALPQEHTQRTAEECGFSTTDRRNLGRARVRVDGPSPYIACASDGVTEMPTSRRGSNRPPHGARGSPEDAKSRSNFRIEFRAEYFSFGAPPYMGYSRGKDRFYRVFAGALRSRNRAAKTKCRVLTRRGGGPYIPPTRRADASA